MFLQFLRPQQDPAPGNLSYEEIFRSVLAPSGLGSPFHRHDSRRDHLPQTDLASMTVTPLTRQASAPADWQTIYDYSGGEMLPPGTRLTADGKWIDPVLRKDKSGSSNTNH